MTLSIDHVVISVNDVNTAIETYRALGFNAFYGGKHASGQTHNGLIVFNDGSYLELIALVDPNQSDADNSYELIRADKSEGYSGFALISDNMEADIARMQVAGIQPSAITSGGRTRTDGTELKWKIASLDDGRNPFIITDETPRILRVPAEGDTIVHENLVQGIADIRLLVADLDTAVQRYTAIVGSTPIRHNGTAVFALASGTITLSAPVMEDERAYVRNYGEVPYRLTLIGVASPILPEQAHGARFAFTG
jgi:catechol 2,3-dioxygenase-like lactoylglutathione lyase family enzyme